MDITVTIKAPELSSAITALATALSGTKFTLPEKADIATKAKPAAPVTPTAAPASGPASGAIEPELAVTFEAVRAKLAAVAQAGKQAEVKKLLNKYGAAKLSDIPKNKYAELMADVEGIG